MNDIQIKLKELSKEDYKKFSEKIINTKYEILGVKTEILKKIAKDNIQKYKEYFLLKHNTYEEYMIHGFMLGYLKLSFNEIVEYINEYIEYIDCWSMVDSIVSNLKILNKYPEEVFKLAKSYINSEKEFKVRFGYCILLSYYICKQKNEFITKIFDLCNKPHNQYYIQMMVAWLLSVAYIYYKDETLQFIDNNKLDDFTFNKTISKINDSYRVTKEEKQLLKSKRR